MANDKRMENGADTQALATAKIKSDNLDKSEIANWPIPSRPNIGDDLKVPLNRAMMETGLDHPLQVAGHHFSIGCVALEITQRCNLDCSACYLSDYSEAVKDLPLDEIVRRIDAIADYYGPNTNVQVTGGDPTLRRKDELIAIIAHLAKRKLRPALFTNGIKASRSLLTELKQAGLKDVAFHVDTTQNRKGYDSETALNEIRDTYIARARGLGLQIIFNTTIFSENINDVAMLADFFANRATDVHLASFQMIADTGRGTTRKRDDQITQDRVMSLISKGAGTSLNFDFPQIGHHECNRYAKCLVVGNRRVSAFTEKDRSFFMKLLPFTRTIFLSRHAPVSSVFKLAAKLLNGNLSLLTSGTAYAIRKAWALRFGLVKGWRRPGLITFYIHNFMHAHTLDRDRCKACVFMTMTRDGPVSMCVHNAKRDTFILQDVSNPDGTVWKPLSDETQILAENLPTKRLKGRLKASRTKPSGKKIAEITGRIGAIETKRRKQISQQTSS